MSFLTPAFLLLGLLAVPIIVMYMLRLRRREVTVSSTLLWQKLLRDREANAPWQKLRRNLLLILQLLILAALVLALARPFLPSPSVITGSTVVLLDGSASMQATDAAPSRFAAAKTEAAQLIGDLSGGSQMTLIQVGHTPAVLASASSDKTALRRALDAAQPENGPPDWPAALALAAGAAQGFADGRIIIISDGGLPADLPPLPTTPLYLPIGSSAENLAISALATRPTASGPQLFASVANQGAQDREALLSLELDGALYDSRRVPVPANGSANLTWDLPEGTAVITARLSDNEGDNLPLDDVATAVHEGGVTNRALLITEGNLFLEQVFSVLPGIEAFKAAPGTDLTPEDYDLLVFDGVPLPSPLPQADMLLINPPPGSGGGLFSVGGVFSDTVAVRLADSPLLQFVDWRDVHIRQATAVDAPWARPLVEASGGPLLLTGEQNGQRIALLTFDLRDSDLPLQIAFPILMANITGWLSPGRAFDAPAGLRPGDPVTISPSASATAVIVEKPDGRVWTADVGEDALIFAETNQLGLYRVSLRDEQGTRPAGSFAVNLFSPAESAIQPAASLSIGQVTADTTAEGNVGQREWWPWLVAIAILILMVEWWIQHRGPSFPRP
ncbi:MAG: BatA and WFA domain-containing protein [Chloroflexi bacterium]|nr:BatA and WFA domain-containing protein [Chloroflexota bacterium]